MTASASPQVDLLAWASDVLHAHAKDPVFRHRVAVAKGDTRLVSFHINGVLKVHDAVTGKLLAESQPGDLRTPKGGS